MKVVILAGGYGTRLSELTEDIPKPMVKIGNKPIIIHIMERYAKYGYKDFIIALGYKGDYVKNYFSNLLNNSNDFTINFNDGTVKKFGQSNIDWNVSLIDTGLHSMTGRRLKKLKDHIGNNPFFLTYGDGLSNVNISSLLSYHKSHGKICTLTSVRPNARFGELELTNDNEIINFAEKSQLKQGWINGGFLVFEPKIFNFISDNNIMLEREPMKRLLETQNLMAYKHEGFWQCMDTKREYDLLNELNNNDNPPWI